MPVRAALSSGGTGGTEEPLRQQVLDAVKAVEELEQKDWWQGWEVKLCGSESDHATSSVTGRTCGFDAATGRFLVDAADEQEPRSVSQQDLIFPFSGEGSRPSSSSEAASSEEEGSRSEPPSLLECARQLFIPGSHFEGTISIPGMELHGPNGPRDREKYVLEVVDEHVDELGRRSLLARHSAYGDEQACHISIEAPNADNSTSTGTRVPAEVRIFYSDGETTCGGTAVLLPEGGCTISGKVMQLAQGEEGFYEQSMEVTHTFELKRTTHCRAEAEHARNIEAARQHRAEALYRWVKAIPERRVPEGFPWRDIVIRDSSRMCEVQCAVFRRRSALLDSLSFTTTAEKNKVLASLQEAGVRRADCHAVSDETMLRLKTLVVAAVPALRAEMQELDVTCFKAHTRLDKSYCRFDHSLRAAEARIPRSILEGWLRPRTTDDAEVKCAVCFLALDDGQQQSVELPCNHVFHLDCVARWLHSHTTCPNCRRELAQGCGADNLKKSES